MRITMRERVIAQLKRTGKRNKSLKLPMMVCMVLFLLGCRLWDCLFSNMKKYACVMVALLFFVMSSSFNFPIFEDVELNEQPMAFIMENQTAAAADIEGDPAPEVEVLDDSDVLDGYEDTELDNMEEIDKYTLDEILEENAAETEEAPVDESDHEQVELDNVQFSKDDWRLLLINKQHPIPEDYTFNLGTIKGSMKCDERIINDLLAMLQGAKNDGINLVICSPYRDLNRQEVLFNRKIHAYMEKGMSYMEAYKISSQAVTVPGASEHQIGLALDIVSDTYAYLNEGFGDTEAGKWLQEHSCEYGFTLRYPKGKEYITSIEYEPWHFRYVGKEAATVMKQKGICLEEFIDEL